QGGEPAQSAERAVGHDLAEIAQEFDILLALVSRHDFVDRLDAAGRAESARRALAAAFPGAEGEGETGLPGQVDGVVEDHDPAVSEHPLHSGHRLVFQRRVEQLLREVRAQRAADLNRSDRPARAGPAAEALDKLTDRGPERELDEPAEADVAGDLERLRAEGAADAIFGVGLG